MRLPYSSTFINTYAKLARKFYKIKNSITALTLYRSIAINGMHQLLEIRIILYKIANKSTYNNIVLQYFTEFYVTPLFNSNKIEALTKSDVELLSHFIWCFGRTKNIKNVIKFLLP